MHRRNNAQKNNQLDKLHALVDDLVNFSRSNVSLSEEQKQAIFKDMMRVLKSGLKAAQEAQAASTSSPSQNKALFRSLPDDVARMIGSRLSLSNKAHLASAAKDSQSAFQPQINDAKAVWKAIDANLRSLLTRPYIQEEESILTMIVCMPNGKVLPPSVLANMRHLVPNHQTVSDTLFGLKLEIKLSHYTFPMKQGKSFQWLKQKALAASVHALRQVPAYTNGTKFENVKIDKAPVNHTVITDRWFPVILEKTLRADSTVQQVPDRDFLRTLQKSCEMLAYVSKETDRAITASHTGTLAELCGLLSKFLKTETLGAKHVLAKNATPISVVAHPLMPHGSIAVDFSEPPSTLGVKQEGLKNIKRLELTVDIKSKGTLLKLFTKDSKTTPAHTVSGLEAITTAASLLGLWDAWGSYSLQEVFPGKMTFTGTGPLAMWMYIKLSKDDSEVLKLRLA